MNHLKIMVQSVCYLYFDFVRTSGMSEIFADSATTPFYMVPEKSMSELSD